MKHSKLSAIIILALTVLILYIVLKDNFFAVTNALLNANFLWILVAAGAYFMFMFVDDISIYRMIRQYHKNIKFRFVLYLGIVTKFFNGITPLSSGGQPMQVFIMHKNGIPVSKGTNIVIQNYIVFQIAFIIWAVAVYLIDKIFNLIPDDPILSKLALFGFVANAVILVILILICFTKGFNKFITRLAINIVSIFNKKMDKEKQYELWNNRCDEYYNSAQLLIKKPKVFLRCVLDQGISLFFYYGLQYAIIIAMNLQGNISFLQSLIIGEYVFLIGCYVPIPGATGGMEYAFMGLFSLFIANAECTALMLVWRFITYYLPTIIGAIFYNIGGNKLKDVITS